MIDESLRIILEEKHGYLNFNGLLAVMEASNIDFKDVRLKGPMGMASLDCIYLDTALMMPYDKIFFFVIVHEMAHYKRILKLGRQHILSMMSCKDFDEFCGHIINEEIIADRYGRYCYYKLNGELFPEVATQQLENPYKQEQYRQIAVQLFGVIDNNEESYKKLVGKFIYEV